MLFWALMASGQITMRRVWLAHQAPVSRLTSPLTEQPSPRQI